LRLFWIMLAGGFRRLGGRIVFQPLLAPLETFSR
jgi:hypothetical protein